MKITLEAFHALVGENLMYCQCIEENVKRIYCHLQQGEYALNRLRLEQEKKTLGQVITALQEIDGRSAHPFFTAHDYEYLFRVTRTRNEYAHSVYIHFCYLDDEAEFNRNFDLAADQAAKDAKWLYALYSAVEDARLLFPER